MSIESNRLEREKITIRAMIEIYCKAFHNDSTQICKECSDIYNYASFRIDKCPHKDMKPSCAKCEIHCFNKIMRDKVKKIMRFSGPKMIIYHPILSMYHYIDSFKSGALKDKE
ncbi:MAG: nitrous oxide-stimulated promoter family protein [Desulfobacterales bacterium]|nr:nitrous oxide-stimulated promoter family protein [Desulfobacterales bacterium]